MEEIIKKDLYRYVGTSGFWSLIKGFNIPGFKYTYFLRKANNSSNRSIKGIIYRIMLRRYTYRYGIQIPVSAKIGEGFYIGHFGNIVINNNVVIGKNCNIAQGVTIGEAYRGKLKGCPTIGDKVWIGANVVIVGNITIGNNILIAPNSFVNFDVPSDSLVIGNKCKVKNYANPTEDYINNIMNPDK